MAYRPPIRNGAAPQPRPRPDRSGAVGRYSPLWDVTATMDITADWLTSSTISA